MFLDFFLPRKEIFPNSLQKNWLHIGWIVKEEIVKNRTHFLTVLFLIAASGSVIGAIGVSGNTPKEDEEIAIAAADTLKTAIENPKQ